MHKTVHIDAWLKSYIKHACYLYAVPISYNIISQITIQILQFSTAANRSSGKHKSSHNSYQTYCTWIFRKHLVPCCRWDLYLPICKPSLVNRLITSLSYKQNITALLKSLYQIKFGGRFYKHNINGESRLLNK